MISLSSSNWLAGKTTLLNYILNKNTQYKVAVLVNDMSEVNIDAKLVKDTVVRADQKLVEMSNGCIWYLNLIIPDNLIKTAARSEKISSLRSETWQRWKSSITSWSKAQASANHSQ